MIFASVLGALIPHTTFVSGDVNEVKIVGVYGHNNNATNTPFPYGILIVFPAIGSNYQVQFDINLSTTGAKFALRLIGESWSLFNAG